MALLQTWKVVTGNTLRSSLYRTSTVPSVRFMNNYCENAFIIAFSSALNRQSGICAADQVAGCTHSIIPFHIQQVQRLICRVGVICVKWLVDTRLAHLSDVRSMPNVTLIYVFDRRGVTSAKTDRIHISSDHLYKYKTKISVQKNLLKMLKMNSWNIARYIHYISFLAFHRWLCSVQS